MRLSSWTPEISLIAAAVAVFVSTDIDDLALLTGWFSDRTYRTSHVLLGQLLGIGVLVAISVALGLMGFVLPRAALGALGVLPIGIGLLRLSRPQSESDEDKVGSAAGVLMVASVTFAHGSDNLAVYVPFFAAVRTVSGMATIVVVFFVMTIAWVALARWFARHPLWGASVQRWGRRVVPWMLILLGAGIIYEAQTIAWLMEGARFSSGSRAGS